MNPLSSINTAASPAVSRASDQPSSSSSRSPRAFSYSGSSTLSSPLTMTSPHMPKSPGLGQGRPTQSGESKEKRLIVVSNRLPVTISKDDKGEYHFKVGPVTAQRAER